VGAPLMEFVNERDPNFNGLFARARCANCARRYSVVSLPNKRWALWEGVAPRADLQPHFTGAGWLGCGHCASHLTIDAAVNALAAQPEPLVELKLVDGADDDTVRRFLAYARN